MIVTYSEIRAFKQCPARWAFSYQEGLRTKDRSAALSIGTLVHEALATLYQGVDPLPMLLRAKDDAVQIQNEFDQSTANTALAMMVPYRGQYPQDRGWKIKSVELPFEVEIPRPTNRHRALKARYAGKIDLLLEDENGIVTLVDHKTTSEGMESMGRRIPFDLQTGLYALALESQGVKVQKIIYNCLRKPMLRLKKNETHAELMHRVRLDYLERPAHYFYRLYPFLTQWDMTRIKSDLYVIARHMEDARDGEVPVYRNEQACSIMRCPYEAVCLENTEEMRMERYIKIEDVHPELSK